MQDECSSDEIVAFESSFKIKMFDEIPEERDVVPGPRGYFCSNFFKVSN